MLMNDNQVIKSYLVAVGKKKTPTKTGTFYIIERRYHPVWFPHPSLRKTQPELPAFKEWPSPLGSCWMGFSRRPTDRGATFGIHGTNRPKSMGKNKTLGCVRMRNKEALEVFRQVKLGTKIFIK